MLVLEYQLKVAEYTNKVKCFLAYKHEWEDNRHYPPVLILKIKRQPRWGKCKDERDSVKLLKIIRDLTHKHDATKKKTMAIVEMDLELYLNFHCASVRNGESRKGAMVRRRPEIPASPTCAKVSAPYTDRPIAQPLMYLVRR